MFGGNSLEIDMDDKQIERKGLGCHVTNLLLH